jgi:hypothetical protein
MAHRNHWAILSARTRAAMIDQSDEQATGEFVNIIRHRRVGDTPALPPRSACTSSEQVF